MTSLNDAKRAALVVGGVSAVVCASAAYYWVKNKNKNKEEEEEKTLASSNTKNNQLSSYNHHRNKTYSSTCDNPNSSSVTEEEEEVDLDEHHLSESSSSEQQKSPRQKVNSSNNNIRKMIPVNRGGRRNYRALKKCQEPTVGVPNGVTTMVSNGTSASTGIQKPRVQTEAEINATRLAAEFSSTKLNLNKFSATNSSTSSSAGHSSPEGELILHGSHSPSPKGQGAESPSLASDGRSEGSQDSGKGGSTVLTSSVSPIEELIEIPPVYEFEIPQDIVGLVIGSKGTTIKYFTNQSGAQIVIRKHFASDRHKICTIEGTREQINKCLRLIRRKFPPSRFPELKLTPLLPPPVVSPRTPVNDSIIRLNLPQGVKCEVVVSSLVDAGHFFLQQPTHPTFPSLARLDECMSAVYFQSFGVPGLPRPIDIGVICAAPVLGGWYRAQTMETFDDTDEVLVKFVDYGGYSKIQASDLRQIRSDLMALPFQATECHLAHVKPAGNETTWSPEATAFFEEFTCGKLVEALVVGTTADNVTLVELHCVADSKSNETEMLNRILVDKKFAVWVDE